MLDMDEFWRLVAEIGASQLAAYLPPTHAWAITTGDAATQETVEGVTSNLVAVWLDGAAQTPENKVNVVLPYGVAAPAAGQRWLVTLPNYRGPGILDKRLS